MGALKIIQQIKPLPLAEKQEVKAYVSSIGENSSDPATAVTKRDAFDAALDSVFEKHGELLQKLAQ